MNDSKTLSGKRDLTPNHLRITIGLGKIIGESPAFAAALQRIPTVAKHDVCGSVAFPAAAIKPVCSGSDKTELVTGVPIIPPNRNHTRRK